MFVQSSNIRAWFVSQVIGAVFVHPKLRTKANVYIVNLAIADSNVAYVVQVFSIIGKYFF